MSNKTLISFILIFAVISTAFATLQGHPATAGDNMNVSYEATEDQWCYIKIFVRDISSKKLLPVNEIIYNDISSRKRFPEFTSTGKAHFIGKRGTFFSLKIQKRGYYDFKGKIMLKGHTLVEVFMQKIERTEPKIEQLIACLQRGDVTAIDDIVVIGKPAIPALLKLMANEDLKTVGYSAVALSRIGRPAIPYLITNLESTNNQIRKMSIEALVEIGTPAILPLIDTIMKNRREKLTSMVQNTLIRIGQPVINPIEKTLGEKSLHALAKQKLKEVLSIIKGKKKQITIEYTIPKSFYQRDKSIKILISDVEKRHKPIRMWRSPGDTISESVTISPPATIKIFVDGQLKKEEVF